MTRPGPWRRSRASALAYTVPPLPRNSGPHFRTRTETSPSKSHVLGRGRASLLIASPAGFPASVPVPRDDLRLFPS